MSHQLFQPPYLYRIGLVKRAVELEVVGTLGKKTTSGTHNRCPGSAGHMSQRPGGTLFCRRDSCKSEKFGAHIEQAMSSKCLVCEGSVSGLG